MIDLHSHTTASDGILSPTELLTLAHETGLSALAITDHDTLGVCLEEGASAARNVGIRFIPGVEIEINFPDGQFHLLGLGLEGDIAPLQKLLDQLQASREDRNLAIIHRLNTLEVGYQLGRLACRSCRRRNPGPPPSCAAHGPAGDRQEHKGGLRRLARALRGRSICPRKG
jgi:predicted metal-dependent phosphoesterase TrpH